MPPACGRLVKMVKMTQKSKSSGRGGRRDGAGRPRLKTPTFRVLVSLTEEERDKFKTLGGSKWLKKLLAQK